MIVISGLKLKFGIEYFIYFNVMIIELELLIFVGYEIVYE